MVNLARNRVVNISITYTEAPEYLTDTEVEMLEKGESVNVVKSVKDDKGGKREVLVEFDQETNEFIVVDTGKIQPPEAINDIPLTAKQKEKYRKGEEVQTDDGCIIQYSAKDKQAMRADNLALIVSVLIDGGISYILLKGLNALFNKNQEEPGKNFYKAKDKLAKAEAKQKAPEVADATDTEEEISETISR